MSASSTVPERRMRWLLGITLLPVMLVVLALYVLFLPWQLFVWLMDGRDSRRLPLILKAGA